MRRTALFFLLLASTMASVACLNGKNFKVDPDQVLFDRGSAALEMGKLDVAMLDFETLINTYPESKYTATAKQIMSDDPRVANCSTPPDMVYFGGFCAVVEKN